jgi:hypothetical protein
VDHQQPLTVLILKMGMDIGKEQVPNDERILLIARMKAETQATDPMVADRWPYFATRNLSYFLPLMPDEV